MEELHVRISDLRGDLLDRQRGMDEQVTASLDAHVLQIFVEGLTGDGFEYALKMAGTHVEGIGHFLQR